MEGILIFIVIIFGWAIFKMLVTKAAHVVKKVVTGKDTYFGPAMIKLVDETLEDSNLKFKNVMFRGKLPVRHAMKLSFAISILDSTDGEKSLKPIISIIDSMQEDTSTCYQASGDIGSIDEGDSFTDWVKIGAIVPNLLQPPRSGDRKLTVIVRFFDTNNAPSIHAGFRDGDSLWEQILEIQHHFDDIGYEDASEHREEAQSISLKIGMAVAMADGTLDDLEGEVLQNWVKKTIASFSDDRQSNLKDLYNEAMKEAHFDAENGNLSLSPLVERLSSIGDKKSKSDAVELCFDIMAADGVADQEEMSVIKTVAEALELDMAEIESMREQVTLNLSSSLSGEDGLEALVGLVDSWSPDQKKKHLRTEFQKWSNRINALDEGDEKVNAQSMLDNIAILRKKYG